MKTVRHRAVFFYRQVKQICVIILRTERICMKYIRILVLSLFVLPFAARAASSEFMVAAQLLSAAKNADIQQVQALVNNGANVNFVDSTGMSIVCTALMNNDVRAAQILQMYGADASNCDRQIKQYRNKNTTRTESGGLFGGLSSAQSMTLAAAGAAVVIGGLFLLTDVFDPGNDNGSSSSTGNRGEDNPGGNTNSPTEKLAIPYGPAMPTAETESANYADNLNLYSPSDSENILAKNFKLMNNMAGGNYLLMMRGYSALARGYMGMRTLRDSARAPITNDTLKQYNLGSIPVAGGRPVNVGLITANGVNASDTSSLGDRLLPWTTFNGTSLNQASTDMVSSKYYNNKITIAAGATDLSGMTAAEDSSFVGDFDLSGSGTAINNTSASALDNLLAKIIGGKEAGYADADYMGFMPNGQMSIFRTGGGRGYVSMTETNAGSYTMAGDALATGDTLTLDGKTYTVTRTGNAIVATNGDTTYNGYIGADGALYMNDAAYTLADNTITQVKKLDDIDYFNYKALLKSGALWAKGDIVGGRSRPDIIANASVISPLHSRDTKTISDILSVGTDSTKLQAAFIKFVNQYYDVNTTDGVGGADALPGTDASAFFNGLGSTFSPLVIFSTGAFETDSAWSGKTLEATFENSAPLVFPNLEHLFMSVVAVGQTGTKGTTTADSVAGYSPSGTYALSQWSTNNGTPDDTSDDKYYKARACGAAGRGTASIDPWCFAATGLTDELAVAAAAGAAGAVKSAFDYMNNKQLFMLLALTADGPFLGSTDTGTSMTKDALISYLKSMYTLPNEYDARWRSGGENYLDVFKEVFGYGLINVARATTPAKKLYYYTDGKIVSSSGNAYWRAATNTTFRTSSAFSPRMATISAPFFDKLESIDGELALPRIWKNEFAVGTQSRRGLYMGDVLGEFRADNRAAPRTQIGNIGFSMTTSPRAYNDNMGGLDTLQMDYARGAWNFAAGYQHHLTDGASRFDGMSNPILNLASNAVTTDAIYNSGRWSFGARAFSGAITDEELLENDPTISSQYAPARLGLISGAQSHIAWHGDKFGFTTAFGNAHESDTLLGAQTGGLLNLGAGDTMYIDSELSYRPTDNLTLRVRGTFARTTSDMAGGAVILGMSDIYSDAIAAGVDWGNFNFTVARPLGVNRGTMQYSYADYDLSEVADGKYDIVITDAGVRDVDLTPENREVRLTATYRHALGAFTDGALGFIYRVNPNHTSAFGNESIFMLKLNHRLGI